MKVKLETTIPETSVREIEADDILFFSDSGEKIVVFFKDGYTSEVSEISKKLNQTLARAGFQPFASGFSDILLNMKNVKEFRHLGLDIEIEEDVYSVKFIDASDATTSIQTSMPNEELETMRNQAQRHQ